MHNLSIPGTTLETSRFIFGTSSLFQSGTSRTRRRLLDAAVHHGFEHFDTAPYYGFGMAERDLAPVLKANPTVKVTTKVGIYPPGGADAMASSILLRKVGGKLFPSLARPQRSFDLRRAKLSLEQSLRRLGRERIDLYMLHEPQIDQVSGQEWLEWLESLRAGGQVGLFGLATTCEMLRPFLDARSALVEVAQVADSLEAREADLLAAYQRPLQITYGYVSRARAAGDRTEVSQILRQAAARNAHGPIIVSTKRLERIGQYSRVLETTG
jgi:aryl-alcohol dehydrogenase-like predicted oxidoreductase